ncbi:hypothetical protein [Nostoc sp.]|uniref:hypothetical protein n=1 Tax=Nostoc sp. TaxID=1180 RepID=UPI002FF7FD3D
MLKVWEDNFVTRYEYAIAKSFFTELQQINYPILWGGRHERQLPIQHQNSNPLWQKFAYLMTRGLEQLVPPYCTNN